MAMDQQDGLGVTGYLVIGGLVAVLWYAVNSVWLVEAYDSRGSLVYYDTFADRDDAEEAAKDLRSKKYNVKMRTFRNVFNGK